jgi:ribosome-associated protein
VAVSEPRDVEIRGESIRLGQFLKLADAVDNGAEVRPLLMRGSVLVNAETETRRGRQLGIGDVVSLGGDSFRVVRTQDRPGDATF